MKDILLIGPGSSILDFEIPNNKDYLIISFSGVFNWFEKSQTIPDYWTFFDPNSIFILSNNFNKVISKEYLNKVKNKTILLYNNIQGTSEFYDKGFTTSKGMNWNSNNTLQKFSNYFKTTEIVQTEIKKTSLEVSQEKHNIIVHGRKVEICKFSSFLLPLVYHKFPNIKNIDIVGFGDYNSPRAYQKSSGGYNGYKRSFDLMVEAHKKYLRENNINIKFYNNSYYKKLEWKK